MFIKPSNVVPWPVVWMNMALSLNILLRCNTSLGIGISLLDDLSIP